MALTDRVVLPLMAAQLSCFRAKLLLLASPPAQIGFRVGNQAGPLIGPNVDECCAGLAWVRYVDSYSSSDSFPSPTVSVNPCGVQAYAVIMELGVARCIPWGSGPDNQDPPTQDDWDTGTMQVLNDDAAMRQAIRCCYPTAVTPDMPYPSRIYVMGQYTPLAVEGGCTGGTRTVTVQVIPPCEDC